MRTIPWWMEHYKYMPNPEGDEQFAERVSLLREDREFDRMVVRYNMANDDFIDRWYKNRTPVKLGMKDTGAHPNTYYAMKGGTPYLKYSPARRMEISEDVITLGEAGAAVIADVDPVLRSANAELSTISESYSSMIQLLIRTGGDSTKLMARNKEFQTRCGPIERLSIENYVQKHKDATATKINEVITKRVSFAKRVIDKFGRNCSVAVNSYMKTLMESKGGTSAICEYKEVIARLNEMPVKNFVDIVNRCSLERYAGEKYVFHFSKSKDVVDEASCIIWAMGVMGFTEVECNGWFRPIKTPEEFVIMAHMLGQKQFSTTNWRFRVSFPDYWGIMNMVESCDKLSKIRAYADRTYHHISLHGTPDAEDIYLNYIDSVKAELRSLPKGDKSLIEHIRYSVWNVIKKSDAVVSALGKATVEYDRIMRLSERRAGSAQINEEVNILDYAQNVEEILDQIRASDVCTDNSGNYIGYTRFAIDEDTKSDGIALCLVLKEMRSHIGEIHVTDDHKTVRTVSYGKVYEMIQSHEYGEEFDIEGIVFWNSTFTNRFEKDLRKISSKLYSLYA